MRRLFIVMLTIICLSFGTSEARSKKHSIADAAMDSIETSLIKPPQDQEACFSPDEPCDTKLIKFVESAKESIDVAIYDINIDLMVHQLLVQSKKIPVRIIVDRRQAKGDHSLVPLLIKAGANIRYGHQRGIFHNKFTIVDGKMVETGSFNYTNHASQANNENQFYTSNPSVVARYKDHFEDLWNEADPVTMPVRDNI